MTIHRPFIVAFSLVLSLCALACDTAEPEPPPTVAPSKKAENPVQDAPKKADVPTPADKPPAEPIPDAIPDIEGIPALLAPGVAGATNVSIKNRNKAKLANRRGLKAHRAKKYAKAIEHYTEALGLDPANIIARYNLACALALSGEGEKAVGVLSQLRGLGCGLCRKQLIFAREDKDFEAIRDDDAFKRVTRDVSALPDNLDEITHTVRLAIKTMRFELVEALINPQRIPTVTVSGEGRTEQPVVSHHELSDSKKLLKIASELSQHDVSTKIIRCKGMCCSLAPPKEVLHNNRALTRVCYWLDKDDTPTLTEIVITDYP